MLEKIGLDAVMNMGQFNTAMTQYNQSLSGMDTNTAGIAGRVSVAFQGVNAAVQGTATTATQVFSVFTTSAEKLRGQVDQLTNSIVKDQAQLGVMGQKYTDLGLKVAVAEEAFKKLQASGKATAAVLAEKENALNKLKAQYQTTGEKVNAFSAKINESKAKLADVSGMEKMASVTGKITGAFGTVSGAAQKVGGIIQSLGGHILKSSQDMGAISKGVPAFHELGSAAQAATEKIKGVGVGTIAMGNLLADGIKSAAGALKNEFMGSYQKVADQERMQLSLQSMLTSQYLSGTTTMVEAGKTRAGLSEDEQKELAKLTSEMQKYDLAARKAHEAEAKGASNSKLSALAKEELGMKTAAASTKAQEAAARIAELTAKSQQEVTVMKEVTTGQMEMTEARAAAVQPAADLLKWVEKLGAESPFESTQIAQSLKMSMSFGATADEAKKLTSELVDFAAAGGKDAAVVSTLGVVFGQIRGAGKLMGQDMMQLVGAGVPVNKILKQMGMSMEDVSSGAVKADKFFDAFSKTVVSEGWSGEAKRQANSLSGLSSTLEEFVANSKRNLAKGAWQALQEPMAAALGFITSEENQAAIENMGLSIGNFVKGAIAPMAAALGNLSKGLAVLQGGGTAQQIFASIFGADVAIKAQPIFDIINSLVNTFQNMQTVLSSGAGLDVIFGNIGFGLGNLVDIISSFLLGTQNSDLMLDVFGQAFNRFGAVVQTVGGILAGAGQTIIQTIGGIFQSLAKGEGLASVFTSLGIGIAQLANGFLPFLAGGQQVGVSVGLMGAAFGSMGKTVEMLASTYKTYFSIIISAVQTAVASILPTLLKIVPVAAQLTSVIGTMAANIVSFFTSKIMPTVTKLTDIFNVNFPKIALAVTSALTTIQKLWDSVWPRLQNVLTAVMEQVGPIVAKVAEIITDLALKGAATFEKLRPHLEKLAEQIETKLVPVIKDMGKWFMDTLGQIQVWFDKNWPMIESILTKAVDFVTTKIIPLITALWENVLKPLFTGAVAGALTMATGILKILDGDLAGGIAGIWEGIKKLFNTSIEVLLGLVESFFGKGVREKIEGAAGVVIAAVTQFVEGFVGAMKEKWEGLVMAWNIASAIVAQVATIKKAGEDIIEGFLDGLRDTWQNVQNWWMAKFEGLPKWLRDYMQMKSPSRLMAEIGQNTILGFLVGMTEEERNVVARSAEIASAIVSAFRSVLELGNLDVPTLTLDKLNQMADAYAAVFTRLVDVMRGVYNGTWMSSTGTAYAPGPGGVYDAGTAFGISGGVQDLILTMKDTLDLLTSLAKVEFPPDLSTRISGLADAYAQTITALVTAANSLMAAEVNAAAALMPGAANLLGVVAPAIDALAALAEYEETQGLAQKIGRLQFELSTVAIELDLMARAVVDDEFPTSAAGAGYINQVVSMVIPALDALKALGEYEGTTYLSQRIGRLQFELSTVAIELDLMARAVVDDIFPASAEAAGYINQVVGMIRPAVDALAALGEYREVRELPLLMLKFRLNMQDVLRQLVILASGWDMEGLKAASIASQAMLGIVALVKPGIEALNDLFTYTVRLGIAPRATAFASDLRILVEAMNTFASGNVLAMTQAASAFYEATQGMIAVITPALEALKELTAYELIVGLPARMQNFATNLLTVAQWLRAAFLSEVGRLGREGLSWQDVYGAAAEFYTYVGQMVSVVKPGIEALGALFTYVSVGSLETQAHTFAADLLQVAQWLRGAFLAEAGRLGQQGLDWSTVYRDAASFYGYVQGMIGIIKPGLDAIKDLTGYVRVTGIAASAASFAIDIIEVMSNLKFAFEGWVYRQGEGWEDLMASAGTFYTLITGMIGAIKPGIDAIKGLTDYVVTTGIAASAMDFATDIIAVMSNLKFAFEGWVYGQGEGWEDLMASAVTFYNSISGMVAVVKPGLDAIDALTGYMESTGLDFRAATFSDDLNTLARALVTGFTSWTATGGASQSVLTAAATFYTTVGQIVAIVKPAIDAIYSVGTYVTSTGLVAKIEQFRVDLTGLLTKMLAVYTQFKTSLLPESGVFFTTVGTIATTVKTAIDTLKALGDYVALTALPAKIAAFTTDLTLFLNGLLAIYNTYRLSALPQTAVFFTTVQTILGSIKASIDYLKAIAGASGATPGGGGSGGIAPAMDTFSQDLTTFYVGLQGIFSTWTERHSPLATEQAAAFALATATVTGSVVTAINNLTTLANYRGQGAGLNTGIAAFKLDMEAFYTAFGGVATKAGGLNLPTGAATLFAAASGTAVDKAEGGIDDITGLASTTEGTQSALYQFVENLRYFLQQANTATVDMMGRLLDSFRGQNYAIGQVGVAIIAGFKGGMEGGFPATINGVSTNLTNILNAFRGQNYSIGQVGVAVIDGFKGGMESKYAVTLLSAQNFAKGVKDVLAQTLQVGSPSKVAFDIGAAIPLGMAGGIMAGAGTAISAAAALASGVGGALGVNSPSLLAAGMGGMVAPMTGASAYGQSNINQSRSVSVNMGGVTIANGMDAALFEARVRQVVTESIRR